VAGAYGRVSAHRSTSWGASVAVPAGGGGVRWQGLAGAAGGSSIRRAGAMLRGGGRELDPEHAERTALMLYASTAAGLARPEGAGSQRMRTPVHDVGWLPRRARRLTQHRRTAAHASRLPITALRRRQGYATSRGSWPSTRPGSGFPAPSRSG